MVDTVKGKENLDQEYEALQMEVSKARTPEDYVNALGALIGRIQEEIRAEKNLKGTHDMARTYHEWTNTMGDYWSAAESLKKGDGFNVTTNTLNNHGSPHMPFPGEFNDPATRSVSHSMAKSVVDYVNARAGNLLPSEIVENAIVRTDDYPQKSFCQVTTTVKGFKQPEVRSVVKKAPQPIVERLANGDQIVGGRFWRKIG